MDNICTFTKLFKFNSSLIIHNHVPLTDPIPKLSSSFNSNSYLLYSKIITPYSFNVFEVYASKSGIMHLYLFLVAKLASGFPLGPIPSPLSSYTPDNLSSLLKNSHIAQEWIDSKVELGRERPFSQEELESQISSFISSPLQMLIKTPYLVAPAKAQTCVNLSYWGPNHNQNSLNDYINPDVMVTQWGTVEQCAKLVWALHLRSISCSHTLSGCQCPHRSSSCHT